MMLADISGFTKLGESLRKEKARPGAWKCSRPPSTRSSQRSSPTSKLSAGGLQDRRRLSHLHVEGLDNSESEESIMNRAKLCAVDMSSVKRGGRA